MMNNSDRIYYSKEAAKRAQRNRMMNATTFLVIGASLGAAVVYVLSQNEDAVKTIEDTLHRGQHTAEKVGDQLGDRLKDIRHTAEDRLEKIR